MAEHSSKLLVELPWPECAPPGVVSPDAPGRSRVTLKQETIPWQREEQSGARVQPVPAEEPPKLPEP